MALDINLIEDLGSLNIARPTILDRSPYLFRQTPQNAGNIVSPTIIGGSVGWNQLVQNGDFEDSSVWTKSAQWSIANNKATFNASATGATFYNLYQSVSTVVGHKYLAYVTVSDYSASDAALNRLAFSTAFGNYPTAVKEITGNGLYIGIVNASATAYYIGIKMQLATDKSASQSVSNINCIDLTLMLGSIIADYVYSLEQATTGSGIAWLKSYGFLTKDYYAYDSGSIQSVKTTGRQTRNSNDEIIATYPIDDVELRGIPKLDASNNLYYDGDTYEASGSVTRKYGIVDLGTLNWTYAADATPQPYFYVAFSPIKKADENLICAKYSTALTKAEFDASDKVIYRAYLRANGINIRDTAYTDAATFKTAMSGVYLVYELDTSTTESADPYATPQIVGATEEFIDERDVPIPVGQESQYAQTQPYGLKIRLMEEGISIVNSSPLLRSASSPEPDTEKALIGDIVKEPITEPIEDTVKERPDDEPVEDEDEPVEEEVNEDDNEG